MDTDEEKKRKTVGDSRRQGDRRREDGFKWG